MYHTIVIGGGCLGAAAAISLQRKLNKLGKGDKVCLVEKAVLCAAESSRHSGIVRSANADPDASIMASMSSKMWKKLSSVWGLDMEIDEFGAIWIAKKNGLRKARVSRDQDQDIPGCRRNVWEPSAPNAV